MTATTETVSALVRAALADADDHTVMSLIADELADAGDLWADLFRAYQLLAERGPPDFGANDPGRPVDPVGLRLYACLCVRSPAVWPAAALASRRVVRLSELFAFGLVDGETRATRLPEMLAREPEPAMWTLATWTARTPLSKTDVVSTETVAATRAAVAATESFSTHTPARAVVWGETVEAERRYQLRLRRAVYRLLAA